MSRKTATKTPPMTGTVGDASHSMQGAPPPERVLQPSDVIPEGDYAGMTYNEVIELVSGQVNEAYANLSLPGVRAIHDKVLTEIMAATKYFEGDAIAHEAAILYAQTLLPYLETPTPKLNRSWGELMALRERWSQGDDE